MLPSIWEKYFLFQFLRTFLFVLLTFFGLYVLIDYAGIAGSFAHHKSHPGWLEIVRYYLFVFSSKAEILIPLAILIAIIQTLCSLNTHSELVAFMAAGFSLRSLMRPFFFAGLIFVSLMYANEQFLLPAALKKLKWFEDAAKRQRHHHTAAISVKNLVLEDESVLIFQNYDTALERFFDVYWIESIDSIYRMKYLSPSTTNPIGYFVDHLVRQGGGELRQIAAYTELALPKLKFNQELLQSTIIDPDILSISELGKEFLNMDNDANEKESRILSAFYWKLMMPWLCLLAIIAPAPYCVRYSRNLPVFLIFAFSLFGLIAFYTFMDAALVVSKRQVLSPFLAICGSFLFCLALFGWRFKKINSY